MDGSLYDIGTLNSATSSDCTAQDVGSIRRDSEDVLWCTSNGWVNLVLEPELSSYQPAISGNCDPGTVVTGLDSNNAFSCGECRERKYE